MQTRRRTSAQAQLLAEKPDGAVFLRLQPMFRRVLLYYIVVKQDFAQEGEEPIYASSRPICLTDGVTMVSEGEG